MGIIGMKVPARGRLLSTWTPPPSRAQEHMWEGMVPAPTPGTLTMREAMYYTLSRPVSTVIIGCDTIAQLEENVQSRARVHAAQRCPGRFACGQRRAGRQAVALLPLLRSALAPIKGAVTDD